MTHLPFIAAAYGLTLALAGWLAISATVRLSRARRRLAAYEGRPGRGPSGRSGRAQEQERRR